MAPLAEETLSIKSAMAVHATHRDDEIERTLAASPLLAL
jgi:hypothetical protein